MGNKNIPPAANSAADMAAKTAKEHGICSCLVKGPPIWKLAISCLTLSGLHLSMYWVFPSQLMNGNRLYVIFKKSPKIPNAVCNAVCVPTQTKLNHGLISN